MNHPHKEFNNSLGRLHERYVEKEEGVNQEPEGISTYVYEKIYYPRGAFPCGGNKDEHHGYRRGGYTENRKPECRLGY